MTALSNLFYALSSDRKCVLLSDHLAGEISSVEHIANLTGHVEFNDALHLIISWSGLTPNPIWFFFGRLPKIQQQISP
jgi:hypothetical protein